MTRRRRTQSVRDFILNRAGEHPGDVSRITGQTSEISDQSVAKHGENLVDQGLLRATGRANGREYSLEALFDHTFDVNVAPGMAETQSGPHSSVAPLPAARSGFPHGVNENVLERCQFGFTEILNNVAAHVGSSVAPVRTQGTAVNTKTMVSD